MQKQLFYNEFLHSAVNFERNVQCGLGQTSQLFSVNV
jgi:hypothetical protein